MFYCNITKVCVIQLYTIYISIYTLTVNPTTKNVW